MKQIGLGIFFLIFLSSCQNHKDEFTHPLDIMPSNSEVVFKVNTINEFETYVNSRPFIFDSVSNSFKAAFTLSKQRDVRGPLFLSFFKNSDGIPAYKLVTKKINSENRLDSASITKQQKLKAGRIDSIKVDSIFHYYKEHNNYLISSNLKSYLNKYDKTGKAKISTDYMLLKTSPDNVMASVAFNTKEGSLTKLMLKALPHNSGNTSALDIKLNSNSDIFNGVISYSDSIKSAIECFKSTSPQNIETIQIIPSDSDDVISMTFDDFKTFDNNRRKLREIDSIYSEKPFLNFTNEIAKANQFLILRSLDTELVLESIDNKRVEMEFRGLKIYKLEDPSLLDGQFEPFFNLEELHYLTVLDNFIVFTKDMDDLKGFVSKALNNNTIGNLDAFKNISNHLSDEASLFIFKNSSSLSKTFNTDMAGYDANVVQFVNEDTFAHVNGIIQKFKKRPKSNEVAESFSTALKNPLITNPQVVKNHITNGYDILVQDAKNQLFLISNSGTILWKKTIDDKIIGSVEQIDMYKNGRLQLVFVTPHRLYVLDRNGRDVAPFPLKFKDEITQPVSVFDYDKNKNYRLLVTQKDELLMYDAKGKSVNGFNYAGNEGVITSQPKHFRIGSKDYIAFKTVETLKILNRRGKTRVKVQGTILFSENELFLYKNQFTSTTKTGDLIQIDTRGTMSKSSLGLPEDHFVTTTSKTLVTMTENILKIKSRQLNLDFGDYTPPQIFYLNDKIYITTTDVEAKKVYLFDSQARPLPNFPVYGTSAAVLQNINGGKTIELITQDDMNKVLVYEIYP